MKGEKKAIIKGWKIFKILTILIFTATILARQCFLGDTRV